MDAHKIIGYPLSTEKAVRVMQSENKLLFIVNNNANKIEIKKAVEELFDVKVLKVNTQIDVKGKKRAYVKLSPESPAIDITTKLGLM